MEIIKAFLQGALDHSVFTFRFSEMRILVDPDQIHCLSISMEDECHKYFPQ